MALNPIITWTFFFADTAAPTNPGPYLFRSFNFPQHYLSFKTGTTEGFIANNNKQGFLVVPCLAGNKNAVSLKLYTKQNFYLKADLERMLINVEVKQTNSDFSLASCFKIRHNQFKDGFVAFESLAKPGHFIRHQGYRLKLHPAASDELYKKDASFSMRLNYEGKLLYIFFFQVFLQCNYKFFIHVNINGKTKVKC